MKNDGSPQEVVGRNGLQRCEMCPRKELNMFCVASEGGADPEDRGCRKADLDFYQECLQRPEVGSKKILEAHQ